MNSIQIAAASALLAISAFAHAEDWKILGSGPKGAIAYDATSVRHDGLYVSVFMRMTYTSPQTGSGIAHDMSIWPLRINCRDGSIRVMNAYDYLRGNLVFTANAYQDLDAGVPGSPMYEVTQAVCPRP